MVQPMNQTDILIRLGRLNTGLDQSWLIRGNKLCKDFLFTDFSEAFGFIVQVALHAEKHNHHPEWSNVYNKLSVALTTHEAHGISERDFALAEIMEKLVA